MQCLPATKHFGIIFLVLCIAARSHASRLAAVVADRPHILLVVADDLGWNDVGWHGSDIRTPVLDSLAAAGTTLEQYYVQPVCSPTRTSLLTGRYPMRYGLLHHVYPTGARLGLPLNETLLPEKLNEAGYQSHMIGKWHLGFYTWHHTPTFRGFQSFYGFYGGAEDYYAHSSGAGLSSHPNTGSRLSGLDLRNQTSADFNKMGVYSTPLFASEAQRIIRNHAVSESDSPLFLYLAFQAVHSPQEVPQVYVDQYKNTISDMNRRKFAGMVSCLDEAIGNVTNTMKEMGLWKKTLMMFTTDNGGPVHTFSAIGASNWPLRGSKHTLWEGGVRGSAFLHGPMLKKGTKYTGLMHATDIFPTLIAAAGANTNHTLPLDGINQYDHITAVANTSPRNEILFNYDPFAPHGISNSGCCGYAGLRQGEWKLLVDPGGPDGWYQPGNTSNHDTHTIPEGLTIKNRTIYLFNPVVDPTEHNDVSKDNPEVVRKLMDRLEEYIKQSVPQGSQKIDPESDPSKHNGVWTPWVKDTESKV